MDIPVCLFCRAKCSVFIGDYCPQCAQRMYDRYSDDPEKNNPPAPTMHIIWSIPLAAMPAYAHFHGSMLTTGLWYIWDIQQHLFFGPWAYGGSGKSLMVLSLCGRASQDAIRSHIFLLAVFRPAWLIRPSAWNSRRPYQLPQCTGWQFAHLLQHMRNYYLPLAPHNHVYRPYHRL